MRGFASFTVSGCVAASLLASCVGSQSGWNGAPPLQPAQNVTAYSGDLLYETNYTSVAFFSFPEGKKIGTLPSGIGHPRNVCSDAAGNVWLPFNVRNTYRLYEFAHGGMRPISTIDVPKHKSAVACALNPTNGDLAVLNSCCGTGSIPS
jgi:hypothetical protein